MRITFVMANLVRTGGHRVIFEVANGLVEKKHGVTIVAPDGYTGWFPLKAKVKNARKIEPSRIPPFGTVITLTDYLNLARKLPDSDVTVATFNLTAYSACLGGKGALVYYIQHYEPLIFESSLYRFLAKMTYHLPTYHWIANSTWLKNILKNKFSKDAFLIHPGVDPNTFHPREIKKEDSIKKIVCLGNLAPWKGFREAVKAIEIVRRFRPVELVSYGSKPISLGNHLVPIRFTKDPTDEELASLYCSGDVVICPSWFESFPLPPLEAMACGTPVVTTRFGTEDYAIHEENALVVTPREPKALANAILRILSDEDLAERLRKNGIKTAQRFTWTKTVGKVEKFLLRILSQP